MNKSFKFDKSRLTNKTFSVFGDSISDVRMASERDREDALKIGFLNENEEENMIYYQN